MIDSIAKFLKVDEKTAIQQIDNLLQDKKNISLRDTIVNFVNKFSRVGDYKIVHPYFKSPMTITVWVSLKNIRSIAQTSVISPRISEINIDILADRTQGLGGFKEIITHELTHVFDPKSLGNAARVARIMRKPGHQSAFDDWTEDELKFWETKRFDNTFSGDISQYFDDDYNFIEPISERDYDDDAYYRNPQEMDAFELECVYSIAASAIRRSFRKKVETLLREPDKILLDALMGKSKILGGYIRMGEGYANFLKSHPQFIRRLRERIYSAITKIDDKQNKQNKQNKPTNQQD
jgi:hypothetical protein